MDAECWAAATAAVGAHDDLALALAMVAWWAWRARSVVAPCRGQNLVGGGYYLSPSSVLSVSILSMPIRHPN